MQSAHTKAYFYILKSSCDHFIIGLNAGTQFLHSEILPRSLVILDLTLVFGFVN
jgi:hypothetical protein